MSNHGTALSDGQRAEFVSAVVKALVLEVPKLNRDIVRFDSDTQDIVKAAYAALQLGAAPPSFDHRRETSPEERVANLIGNVANASARIADALGPMLAGQMARNGSALRETLSSILNSGSHGTVVYCARSTFIEYPVWGHSIDNLHTEYERLVPVHPELKPSRPASYDLAELNLWLHGDQEKEGATMESIYDHLQASDGLKNCLGIQDAEEIHKKHYSIFPRLFQNKALYLWRSVAWYRGEKYAPYISAHEGRTTMSWYIKWTGFTDEYDSSHRKLGASCPAAQFPT